MSFQIFSFYNSFIQLIIEINCRFHQNLQIVYFAFSAHKFVFDVIFKFSWKRYHQNYIDLFCKIEFFLKFNDIIRNWRFFNYILNYSFCRLFFVENIENFSEFTFKNIKIKIIIITFLFSFQYFLNLNWIWRCTRFQK